MAIIFRNRLNTTVSAVGSAGLGDFTIAPAVLGYKTFSAADDGFSFDASIVEGSNWEVRTGCVYTHGTTSLSRGTLEASSTGGAIAFTDTCRIINAPSASYFTLFDPSPIALTSGVTIATNATLGRNFTLTLLHNATLSNPGGLRNGVIYTWRITQGAGGPYTLAYDSKFVFPGGGAAPITAIVGAIDVINGQYFSDTDTILVPGIVQDFL